MPPYSGMTRMMRLASLYFVLPMQELCMRLKADGRWAWMSTGCDHDSNG